MTSIIVEAFLWHEGVWPKQLTSGVMFFRGERITYQQFMSVK